jgi:predicted unusual protein kinase regulating ubiquinone biosynthesis (AarF/ABC1/UbiB family)
VCTALNPAFNVWTAIEPYAQRLAGNESGNALRALAQQAIATAGQLARLPRQLDELTTLIQRGNLAIRTPGLDHRVREFERLARRIMSAVTFAALLLGGIFLKQTDPVFGWTLMAASALPLLHALFAGLFRSGRSPDR